MRGLGNGNFDGNSDEALQDALNTLAKGGLRRTIHELPFTGGVASLPTTNAPRYNLSSNDYLNLIHHPYLAECAAAATASYGVGSGGSRLMGGATPLHTHLEHTLARLVGFDAALLVGSGYLANYGLLTALLGSSDYALFDKLNHASLIDGIMHSGCKWGSFPHRDYQALEVKLSRAAQPSASGVSRKYRNIYIVTDSVFSMDGDRADLVELQRLADTYGAKLIVDESHAMGVCGVDASASTGTVSGTVAGAGLCAEVGVRPYIVVGTLSKAYASYGGFIACSNLVREYLINTMRTFIFSTSLPPAVVATSLGALEIVAEASTSASTSMGQTLTGRAKMFHEMLRCNGLETAAPSSNTDAGEGEAKLLPFSSQIIPVMIYDNEKAVALSNALGGCGVHVRAIRYPTVPLHGARLRFSITLGFDEQHLSEIADAVGNALRGVGALK